MTGREKLKEDFFKKFCDWLDEIIDDDCDCPSDHGLVGFRDRTDFEECQKLGIDCGECWKFALDNEINPIKKVYCDSKSCEFEKDGLCGCEILSVRKDGKCNRYRDFCSDNWFPLKDWKPKNTKRIQCSNTDCENNCIYTCENDCIQMSDMRCQYFIKRG